MCEELVAAGFIDGHLYDSRSISEYDKNNLAFISTVMHPAMEGNMLSDVFFA